MVEEWKTKLLGMVRDGVDPDKAAMGVFAMYSGVDLEQAKRAAHYARSHYASLVPQLKQRIEQAEAESARIIMEVVPQLRASLAEAERAGVVAQ